MLVRTVTVGRILLDLLPMLMVYACCLRLEIYRIAVDVAAVSPSVFLHPHPLTLSFCP